MPWTPGEPWFPPFRRLSDSNKKRKIPQSIRSTADTSEWTRLFSFEDEIGFDGAAGADRDFLLLRPERFLPGFNRIVARRDVAYLEGSVLAGYGKVGMV